MRRAVLVAAAAVGNGGDGASGDANRTRRMDRFGRSGALAGERALAAAGIGSAGTDAAPDARFGVVVGTAFGCRDAVTRHAELLASAARVEDLAPSVFAATVHNAVGSSSSPRRESTRRSARRGSGRTRGGRSLSRQRRCSSREEKRKRFS